MTIFRFFDLEPSAWRKNEKLLMFRYTDDVCAGDIDGERKHRRLRLHPLYAGVINRRAIINTDKRPTNINAREAHPPMNGRAGGGLTKLTPCDILKLLRRRGC